MADLIAMLGLLNSAVSFSSEVVRFASSVTRNERAARLMLSGVQHIRDQVSAMIRQGEFPSESVAIYAEVLKDALEALASDCERSRSLMRRALSAGELEDRMRVIDRIVQQFTASMVLTTQAEARRNASRRREEHGELMLALLEGFRRVEDRLTQVTTPVNALTEIRSMEDRDSDLSPEDFLFTAVDAAQYLVMQLHSDNDTKQRWALEAVRNVFICPNNSPMEVLARHLRDGSFALMNQVPKYPVQQKLSSEEAEASLVLAGAIPRIVALVRDPSTHWAAIRTMRHLSAKRSYHAELIASGAIPAIVWTLRHSGTDVQNAVVVIKALAHNNVANQIQFGGAGVLLPLAVRVFTTEYAKAEAVVALRVLAQQRDASETGSYQEQAVRHLLKMVRGCNPKQQAAAVDTLCALASMNCAIPVLKAAGVPLVLRQFTSCDENKPGFACHTQNESSPHQLLSMRRVKRALYSLGRPYLVI